MGKAGPSFELFGAHTGNCLRVAIALEVLGLSYKPTIIDLASGEHKSGRVLVLNPFGKLPVLVEHQAAGSHVIGTQSNAILFHLSALCPGKLLPEHDTVLQCTILERFFYFLTEAICPGGDSYFLRRNGSLEGAELLSRKTITAIVGAETFLGGNEFFSGDRLGLADVAAIPLIHANVSAIPWRECTSLKSWYRRVMGREDVKRGLEAFTIQPE